MFEKIDNFTMRYLETVKNGTALISDVIEKIMSVLANSFWAGAALVIIVISFPLWLLGKSAQQNVQADESHATNGANDSK